MNETIEKLRFCISIQLYIAKKVQETELLQITRKFFYPTWWHFQFCAPLVVEKELSSRGDRV